MGQVISIVYLPKKNSVQVRPRAQSLSDSPPAMHCHGKPHVLLHTWCSSVWLFRVTFSAQWDETVFKCTCDHFTLFERSSIDVTQCLCDSVSVPLPWMRLSKLLFRKIYRPPSATAASTYCILSTTDSFEMHNELIIVGGFNSNWFGQSSTNVSHLFHCANPSQFIKPLCWRHCHILI